MDVGRNSGRFIKCSDTNKPHEIADATKHDQIVAPDGNLALRAAGDFLFLATWGGYSDVHDVSLEELHAIGFNQRIHRKSRPALALAPTAMAAVNNEWLR